MHEKHPYSARHGLCSGETGGVTAPAHRIDLNADLGEGFGVWRLGDDDALLGVVSSANVACGFHAGDPSIMRRVCERAVAAGWPIGAQVSYRDLAGFGAPVHRRRPRPSWPTTCSTSSPPSTAIARSAGARVAYVKPHGALYNATVDARGAGRGRSSTPSPRYDPRSRCSACPVGAAGAGRGGRTARRRARASPTAATRAEGTLVPRGRPAR